MTAKLPIEEKVKRLKARIAKTVERAKGKGYAEARKFIVNMVKETLNVKAPTRTVVGKHGTYLVATTRAIPGAPPRRITGKLRESVTTKKVGNQIIVSANVMSKNKFAYGRYHEDLGMGKESGKHKFIEPTIAKYKKEIQTILGKAIKITRFK